MPQLALIVLAFACSDEPIETNHAPSISDVQVEPNPAFVDDALTCVYSGYSDEEGDADVSSVVWLVNGILAEEGLTLQGGFVVGDSILCQVTPSDGADTGETLTDELVISNTMPSDPIIEISPTDPAPGVEPIVCQVTTEAVDPDGEDLEYHFTWTMNGDPFESAVQTYWPADTVPAEVTGAGDVWACSLTVSDGNGGETNAVTASVTLNSCYEGWSSSVEIVEEVAHLTLMGESQGDQAGTTVASAGDVDGDGLSDIIIGAGNDAGGYNAGAAYLFFGAGLSSAGALNLAEADYKFTGANMDDWVGGAVSSAGDVDGDGFDDLLIGAHQIDLGGADAGGAYLVMAANLGQDELISVDNADLVMVGEAPDDNTGIALSGAGDVDGDGLDDMFIGSSWNDSGGANSGASYLVLADSTVDVDVLYLADADAKLVGETADDRAGFAVTAGGDIDGDGLTDLVVGAALQDPDGVQNAGATYIVLGSSLKSSVIDLSLADYKFSGTLTDGRAGRALDFVDDIDGDGLPEVISGASGDPDGGVEAGAAYLLLSGSLGPAGTYSLADADYKFTGEVADDRVGRAVGWAGDVDGDGLGDFLVGGYKHDYSGSDSGAAYLMLGASLGEPGPHSVSEAEVKFVGQTAGDEVGLFNRGVGDINGDNLSDFVVSAPGRDLDTGTVYLVLTPNTCQ